MSRPTSRKILRAMPRLVGPGWQPLPSAELILSMFTLAQRSARAAAVYGPSGTGKSCTAAEYQKRNPGTCLVDLSPADAGNTACLARIAAALRPNHKGALRQAAYQVARQGFGLLVLDNAQHLSCAAEESLLNAMPDLGLVFLVTTSGKPDAPHATATRVRPRLWLSRPVSTDMDMLALAWGIAGHEDMALCRQVARKPGGMWNLVRLLRRAQGLASKTSRIAGEGNILAPEHVKEAWRSLRQEL